MNFPDISLLLDYHYWARDRVLAAVEPLTPDQYSRGLGNSFGSVRDTMVHLYSAEWVWYSRWQGDSPKTPLASDQFPDLGTLRRVWTEMEAKIRLFVAQLGEPGMSRLMTYTLMNGTAGTSVFWQMFQHVVNHGSYHRGQVTTMLRQLGVAPPKPMDLIAFYRERG